MEALNSVLLAVQVLSALAMIGLVLLQQGKGADMGAAFGSGASGSLFGASGSGNVLSKGTAICATVFFLVTLSLAYISQVDTGNRDGGGGDVLKQLAAPTSTETTLESIPQTAPAAAASESGEAPAPTTGADSEPVQPSSGADAIPNQ